MSPAERFARLPDLLAADTELRRRGRWLAVDCRIDIGAEPFHLAIRDGELAGLAHLGATDLREDQRERLLVEVVRQGRVLSEPAEHQQEAAAEALHELALGGAVARLNAEDESGQAAVRRLGGVTLRIEVLGARREARIEVVVQDTGIGIPANKLAQIFGAFSQGDTSTTRRYGGTGLGLAISRRLAELMGGRMWGESPGLNHGATFSFTIRAPAGLKLYRQHGTPAEVRELPVAYMDGRYRVDLTPDLASYWLMLK